MVFKIAHLSDLHLTATDTEKRFEPKLSGQLTGMNQAFRQIAKHKRIQAADLVLITGDITDQGDMESWSVFNDTLKASSLRDKTLAIPGNHDVCELMVRFGNKTKLAKADLEKVKKGLELAGQPSKFPWAKIIAPGVVIFGLDTNMSGNLTALENAIGQIGDFQMQKFAELLAKHDDVPTKIVAVHHSPNIPEASTALKRGRSEPTMIYRWSHQIPRPDRFTFRMLCRAAKVRLIVHGHLHEAEDRRVNGIRIIGAPATTEPKDFAAKKKTYRFYEYAVEERKIGVELVEV
ncbi:3',5'-cyclic adenosine monophosphate phosphodiesterase CpdA [Terrihabitans soli]|uniref:3',5'-cyclic adenosine monophosphate phosphodiesterase CpdA n=1 Tax=Terrihabitans soli TaxID=708113 RepID=A0A6S6QLN5_9HYPH|nr:metallophosphoesterase [Terrihabitans soli]BCJ91324.1 3',5'-cyclic adenosine monophosphate phosphodiesterase CpdA [Terrihabitans soli]